MICPTGHAHAEPFHTVPPLQVGSETTTVALAVLPVPVVLVPCTEYVVVDVGDTVPLDCPEPKPLFTQVYELGTGLQLAVNVVEPPRLMLDGAALSEQDGALPPPPPDTPHVAQRQLGLTVPSLQ